MCSFDLPGLVAQFDAMATRILNVAKQVWFAAGSPGLSQAADKLSDCDITDSLLAAIDAASDKGEALQT